MKASSFFILLLFCFAASQLASRPAQATTWTYSKSSILDFLHSWRSQVKEDYTLGDREKDLRLDLIDRLAFQTDRKYADSDLKRFFIDVTWDMALTDEIAENRAWGSNPEFRKNLSLSLKEILEPSENILAFVRSYVEFVTLKAPRPLEDFAASRSYTNGEEIETAAEMTLEEAGNIAAGEVLQFKVVAPEPLNSETPEIQNEITPDQIQNPLHPQTADEHLIL